MATPKKKKTGEGLYKKRFATLKEHRAAVAARKALKGGKNVGPVANADAYGSAIKPKPKTKPATPKPSVAAKRKQNFDGVGPSDAQRRKDSSPEAMAAERAKRKEAVDGVGPSDAQRRKDSSAAAMKPKQHKGGARSSSGNKKSTPSKSSSPTRSRAANRRSSSTPQSRASNARRRGLSNNLREMRAAARRRAHKKGVFKSSYNRR